MALFTLRRRNPDGIFLDADRRCTICDRRPSVCRRFPQNAVRPGFRPGRKKSVSGREVVVVSKG